MEVAGTPVVAAENTALPAAGGTPTVSVITPVYNGAHYLPDCIESVLAQTRTDWEYLVVDNCSADDSASLAERYARCDARIRVIRCDEFVNVHRNFSRAASLMHPASRYCKFLSADDMLYPECLERMVSVAEQHPSAGMVSSYRRDGDRITQTGAVPSGTELMAGRDVLRAGFLRAEYVTGSPTQLLYRADLVRRVVPFFDESVWHSDTDAAYRSLLECDLGFVHQVLTYTRRHSAALTSRSQRMNTYLPNEIRLLIRFGRRVLARQEYRAAIRHMLARYAWYLLRQDLRPARLRDVEFHGYHRSELQRMLGELHADLESRLALMSLRLLTRNPAQPAASATRAAESHRVSGEETRGARSANADCNASTSVCRKSAGSSGTLGL